MRFLCILSENCPQEASYIMAPEGNLISAGCFPYLIFGWSLPWSSNDA